MSAPEWCMGSSSGAMSASASGRVMPDVDWPAGGVLTLAGLGTLSVDGGGDGGIDVGEAMEDPLWLTSMTFLHRCGSKLSQ